MDLSKDLKYDYTYQPPDHGFRQAAAIAGVLGRNERVLWSGQPTGKLLVLRESDYALVPFAFFWTGFALLWEFGALAAVFESGELDAFMLCFPLFGVPFVLIGVYMLGGRFVGDFFVRRRTWYALTDRRVLALTTMRERSVASMLLQKIDRVDIDVYKNGRGTLTFNGSSDKNGKGWKTRYFVNSAMTVNGFPLFEHIDDPKKVYDMVLEAQEDLWAHQRINVRGQPDL